LIAESLAGAAASTAPAAGAAVSVPSDWSPAHAAAASAIATTAKRFMNLSWMGSMRYLHSFHNGRSTVGVVSIGGV
jgi:hypothetical protein